MIDSSANELQQQEPSYQPAPPAPARRRTWLYALLGGGILSAIVVGIIGGMVVFRLFQAQSNIPQLMGADTQIYLTLTPNLSALPGIQRLQSAYPQLFIDQDSSSLDEQLDEQMGVAFKDDIQPWIGPEVAFALSGLKEIDMKERNPLDDPTSDAITRQLKVSLTITARDHDKAQAFLDKQRVNRTAKGQSFIETSYKNTTIYAQAPGKDEIPTPIAAFAMIHDYVVFANDVSAITAMIDRDIEGKDTLADNPRFIKVLAGMPKNAVTYLYVDGPSFGDLVNSFQEQISAELPSEQANQYVLQLQNYKAFEGFGLAVSVAEEGVLLDTVTSVDLSKLDAAATTRMEALRDPIDPARMQKISNSALALLTFKIPPLFKEQLMEAVNAQKESLQVLADFKKEYGIDIEHDFLDWFVGDAALVLLPGQKIGDTDIPATGYFALRPLDKSAAEAGMKKIIAAIEKLVSNDSQESMLQIERIDGVDWQVFKEPESKQMLAGYGFTADELVIGFGTNSLRAATGNDPSILEDSNFKLVQSQLLSPNSGMFYITVGNLVDMLPEELELNDTDTAKGFKPIKAIGISSTPGIDQQGLMRSRMFVYIAP